MGCDWSKSAVSVDDMPNAPYSLLSVSVEEGRSKVSYKPSSSTDSPAGKRGRTRGGRPGISSNSKRNDLDDHDSLLANSRGGGVESQAESPPLLGGDVADTKPKLNISALKPLPASKSKAPEEIIGGAAPARPKISLDLSKTLALPREQTEQQQRFEKLKRYENECTKVNDLLYVSGIKVAENRELLTGVGITHVVNCAGITSPDYYPELFKYKTLYINDEPSANLIPHMYDVLEFINEAKDAGGKVLVHCTQGVSRSCSFCIAWMMLNDGVGYEEGYGLVKSRRGICNPNAGFSSQLVLWGRRISQTERVVRRPRGFEVTRYYTGNDVANMVPILVDAPRYQMEKGNVCVVDTEDRVFVWVGREASAEGSTIAKRLAGQLARYEGSSSSLSLLREGDEIPKELKQVFVEMCWSEPPSATQVAPPTAAAAAAPSFPQGSAPCAIATPRGQRPEIPEMKLPGVMALKLPGGVPLKLPGGVALASPVKEEVSNQAGWGEAKADDEEEESDGGSTDAGSGIRMFEAPGWEELTNFDSDDLWAEKAFLLLDPEGGKARVWIGGEFEGRGGMEAGEFAKSAAEACGRKNGFSHKGDVEVIAEGEEDDGFWDLFSLG